MTISMRAWLLLLLWLGTGAVIEAAESERMRLSDGTEITYALILPPGFQRERVYRALLVFPGGRQNAASVQGGLSRFWGAEAAKRGFIVFSPAAPPGKVFYEKGVDLIPEFLRRQLAAYRIEGEKFHVAGHSNGGVSAFSAAVRYPELFHSVTVLAGFPVEPADFDRLEGLRDLRVTLFVGDRDLDWKEGMEKTRDRLAAAGTEVHLEVIPGNGHLLPDLSFEKSTRIFESFDRRTRATGQRNRSGFSVEN